MLNNGADLSIRDGEGQTALHYAAMCSRASMIDVTFHIVVPISACLIHSFQELITRGVDVDATDNDGQKAIELVDEDDEETKQAFESAMFTKKSNKKKTKK